MKKELLIKLGIIIVVLLAALYCTFMIPVKLGLDLKGGVSATLQAQPTAQAQVNPQSMSALIDGLNKRINGLGVSESTIEKSGNDKIIVQLPGATDANEAMKILGSMNVLEFKIVQSDGALGPTLMTGSDVKVAAPGYDSKGLPGVNITFTSTGTQKFAQITSQNVGKQLAILLNGQVESSPVLETPILNGQAIIQGQFTTKQTVEVANMINAGALPLNVTVLSMSQVGPTLGAISILKSFHAGILALVLIGIFMFIWYRVPGLMAIVSLIIFGFITFAGMQFFGVTFTLPGIAAFILTLGIAVDANVIIFERIKEEMRNGNSVLKSVEQGTSKTMVTIIDAHMTGIIISLILIWLGTGEIKGFAVTLLIGLIASLFTNVWASNIILSEFVIFFKIKSTKLFGVKPKEVK
ncbi:MAG: protein translocase subunit SecD [Fusobacteria bacterium]|nr:protein translocase subunit SecD [Fusobacteriota bacterium]